MSEIKYGLISKTDAETLEKTIDLVLADFMNQPIKVLELGIYSGETGNGIRQYIESKGRECELTGVDSGADGQKLLFPKAYDTIIELQTTAAAYLIPDHSKHIVIVDANHSYGSVVADFFCYKDKVKYDGFMLFHDAAPQAQGQDYQKTGDPEDKSQYISVAKAILDIGLTNDNFYGWKFHCIDYDPADRCGGFAVFKKVL